ncbi:MAG: TonB-dependent receptor plug domain-containing protein [Saprospiraceae bacterium]|nr:TonB-dependent receptor plug domain-containing protein [Saprospiraceae bacterium]
MDKLKKITFLQLFLYFFFPLNAQVVKGVKTNQSDTTTQNSAKQLQTVEVKGQKKGNYISSLDPYHVERINATELKKAPCCNLSESFETNGSVDVVYSDGLTGAKEIQMLGLRGIYTQLLVENRPDFYGLATPFALEYVPGTWIESIDINKGMGSAKNGYQAITGQINTELEKPNKGNPLYINLFGESTGRLEANVQTNWQINKKLSTGLLLHADKMTDVIDKNKDGFMDMPNKKQINGLYRLFYNTDKIHAQVNVQAIKEDRQSGLIQPDTSQVGFPISAKTERFSVFGKLAYMGFSKPFNQIGSQWAATYHDLKTIYGQNKYNGTQRSFYGNIIYSTIINNTKHKLNLGTSYQLDKYTEFLNDKNLSRTEGVLGGFGEYTFSRLKKGDLYNDLSFIGALRLDYHNLYGLIFTPKINLKYNFSASHAIRISGGRGVRVANPIAENMGYLATNRAISIENNLKPEDAWNFGISYIKPLTINDYKGRLNIDIYRTQFTNQVVVDMESDYKQIAFYNLNGKSYANSALIMLMSEIIDGLDFKIACKFNDTRTTYQSILRPMPLIAKHRSMLSFDYHSDENKWFLNLTCQIVGKQRLIDRTYLPPQYKHGLEPFSPAYTLFNISLNRRFRTHELYGGIENITNFTQTKPIIAADNPQSSFFDATQIYAPLIGRRFYLGLRFNLVRSEKRF